MLSFFFGGADKDGPASGESIFPSSQEDASLAMCFYDIAAEAAVESAACRTCLFKVILSQPAPIMVVSPLNLTFNAMQGQSSPPAQVVSITKTGEGKLYWNMDWMMDGAETNRVWLSPSLTPGVVSPGQTEQVTTHVITHGVAPGVHRG